MTKHDRDFSVPAAARRLGFTLQHVYNLVYAGRLPAEKIAGRWHIPAEAIEARLKAREEQ